MIAIFLLAFTLSLFSFGTTPAAAGDVAGVSTHLFLTVLRDYDHDASFSVTYTDALGTHTKPYHAGMEVTAWSPVTITCTNHHVHDWSIDADVQEATIVGVGGITYPGGTGIHVKGTNTIKAFATNFGLHYINIVERRCAPWEFLPPTRVFLCMAYILWWNKACWQSALSCWRGHCIASSYVQLLSRLYLPDCRCCPLF